MSDRTTDADIEGLDEHWTTLFEDTLAKTSSSPLELAELADRHRELARGSDSPGQRQAFLDAADRYERVSCERAAARK